MNKDKWLVVVLIVLFVGYAAVEHYAPEPLSWEITYGPKDKNPYGTFVLYDRLQDVFKSKALSTRTLYELQDEKAGQIILCEKFDPGKEDIETLLEYVAEGNDVLIGSHGFSKEVMDTFGLEIKYSITAEEIYNNDSVELRVKGESVYFSKDMLTHGFEYEDSTGWQSEVSVENLPVLISKSFGKGKLVLTSVPMTFTNLAILRSNGYVYAEYALNLLKNQPVIYNRYYQDGRMESPSIFRFFVADDKLRWVTYLALLGIICLLIISSRRKQRVVPILDKKSNTTLQFIGTIGGLYYRERNYRKVASKLITHFMSTITERYYITDFDSERTYTLLASKCGLDTAFVIQTFDLIHHVKSGRSVSEDFLLDLNKKITAFNIN